MPDARGPDGAAVDVTDATYERHGMRVVPCGTSLAGDDALAERTCEAAPAERRDASGDHDALAAFLADEERVEAVRREAQAEARARAEEWGLGDHLAE